MFLLDLSFLIKSSVSFFCFVHYMVYSGDCFRNWVVHHGQSSGKCRGGTVNVGSLRCMLPL
ncbi:hypothetical protein Patl1_11646 [Pistacia atlantica]|uniref:Uncharacterized protein n=1 Tax=Pistacia atlantica TaxID=434234 RepID=A0ACC1A450_9ROSI|nr:hypothetical protein Patl1_11646 [Pistacia atlantica]